LAVERIARAAVGLTESPAVLTHEMMDDRHRNDGLELLQLAVDEGPVSPWAGKRDIEVVAAGLGAESAPLALGRPAVGGDPVAPDRIGADEATPALLLLRSMIGPDAVDQQSHLERPSMAFPSRHVGQRPAGRDHFILNTPCSGRRRLGGVGRPFGTVDDCGRRVGMVLAHERDAFPCPSMARPTTSERRRRTGADWPCRRPGGRLPR